MSILISEFFTKELIEDIKSAEESISLISAYCKKSILEYIDSNIKKNNISKRLLVRFKLEDLISGVTDFDIYNYCKDNNWNMFVQFDMHGKLYTIDNRFAYIGSPNATNKGFNTIDNGNIEFSKRFELDEEEKQQVENIFIKALMMDDNLYKEMKKQLNSITLKKISIPSWSEDIIAKNINKYDILFAEDFPVNESPLKMIQNEDALKININDSKEEKKDKFYNSKVMQWLLNELHKKGEMKFGEVSEMIHTVIFQDPVKKRKEVKELQVKLYTWIKELGYDNIEIFVIKHSEIIKLKK